jgi:AcrR family transcriptional regulator
VSIAAPYRHFKDKRALLAAIMEIGFNLKLQYMTEAISKQKGDAEKIYYAIGLAYFRMGLEHPQHFRLMVNAEVFPSEEFPQLLEASAKSFIALKYSIQYCQSKGIIGAGDPYHKAMNCWCVVYGFTSLFVEGRLQWLGVNKENAESALKTLISQHLQGNKTSLAKSDFGFCTFTSADSDLKKKQLLDKSYPEIARLFEHS